MSEIVDPAQRLDLGRDYIFREDAARETHMNTLERAAYKAALHCVVFGFAPRFVTANGLRRGVKGSTTHAECTKAFGGDPTDPGPFWPRLFMSLVRRYHAQFAT